MIKNRMKNEKGISLISLGITVIVLVILTNIIIYNVRDNLKLGNLKEMQNDVANLRDKISSYYAQNGEIPKKMLYTNIEAIKSAGLISEVADTGDFYVIDLSAIENLTLNKGKDFEKVKPLSQLTEEQETENTDLYIINEASHNIFYVAGIKIDNDIFYTDYTAEDVDKVAVDLRYIEGVKIPDGYHYAEGTKDIGILIKNTDNTQTYKWIPVSGIVKEIPANVTVDNTQQEDFLKSANAYQGYYKSTTSNEVIYLPVENNWSPMYDKEAIYKDKNGDTAYIPKGFKVSETPGENTIDEGLVVKDSNENEWVWIEVPKSIYKNTEYNEGTAPSSSEDYTKIESVMQAYASAYRADGYTDTFSSTAQHGFTDATSYNNWKNAMLKSVYENGGFYIGRYEVGTDTARENETDSLTTPLVQRNKYPYNFVTCSQAQERVSTQLKVENRTSSLMFGIQWDLVLKFIEMKGYLPDGTKVTETMLKSNSSLWGNYSDIAFNVKRKEAFYTTLPTAKTSWETAANYTTPSSGVLLTTGAVNRNSVLSVYDLAGNIGEWTLEQPADAVSPCTARGGNFSNNGSERLVSYRTVGSAVNGYSNSGFRSALW